MTIDDLRRREHVLQDLLSSSQEIVAQARAAESPALLYLSELLIRRSFDELGEVQRRLEDFGPFPLSRGNSSPSGHLLPPQTDPV